MKTLIIAIALISSITSNADTCIGSPPDASADLGMIAPALCFKESEQLENSSLIKGIYMNFGRAGIVHFKRLSNRNDVCKYLGFNSYVRFSRVLKEMKTVTVRGDGSFSNYGTFTILSDLECR